MRSFRRVGLSRRAGYGYGESAVAGGAASRCVAHGEAGCAWGAAGCDSVCAAGACRRCEPGQAGGVSAGDGVRAVFGDVVRGVDSQGLPGADGQTCGRREDEVGVGAYC